MSSQTVENYLKTLIILGKGKEAVSVSELSKFLQVSKPSANSMVKRLDAEGLIKYRKYKPLVLTEKGKRHAALILRKHRLTEMFLVEKMGFGWEEVHEIAEQIEHIKSPAFFDRMDELLGYPQVDPHGSPIPDRKGNIVYRHYPRLSEQPVNAKVRIVALANSSDSFLDYLNKKGIALGVEVIVHAHESFDGSMTISYDNHTNQVFSKMVCDSLLVSADANAFT
jgi:DtxR family Mn-dependent transcriptional regulator